MSNYISKEKLISHIESEYKSFGEDYDALQILGDIEDFPTEERPHGEWIEKTGMRPPEDKGVKFCSNCMNRQPRDFITHKPIEPDFCPICGASMVKKEGDKNERV